MLLGMKTLKLRPMKQLLTLLKIFSHRSDDSMKDDTLDITKVIHDLATGESTKFRTVIGDMGNHLMAMRHSLPIEEYLDTIASNYGL